MTSRLEFIILLMFGFSMAIQDDNELIGQPEIQCNADTIDMQFRTKKQFNGKVYVKGSYNRPECRVDYSTKDQFGRPVGGIKLNHGACNMDRQRMIAPEGMMFSTVLIISFHPLFLTRMDKAYHIRCMYKEAARTVTAAIDVSNLPTEAVQADLPMPTCSYTIRRDQLDGPILKYAKVGDQVVHRWQCDSEDYGLLVHSCYVEDGQGEKQMIIDERGCHTDRLLLGDPTYVEALNMAYRESFVFKFADRIAVRFQCEIRLCLKDDGGCDGITPPMCSFKDNNNLEKHVVKRNARTFKPKDADMFSQTVYVMDKDNEDNQSAHPAELRELDPQTICLAPKILVVGVTFFTMIFVFFVTIILVIVYHRFCKNEIKNVVREYY
ncbi:CRE-CUTL-11 protein [Caenorhabditis remanei]|uniref:CRE-CUTL-11 protein n=1 Tax=Caenorhabditis remanei TaxID=31234 RepID=E3M273_CAERE|nr:CRE-CUTL-11 protein [Caenorhabditis remanei]